MSSFRPPRLAAPPASSRSCATVIAPIPAAALATLARAVRRDPTRRSHPTAYGHFGMILRDSAAPVVLRSRQQGVHRARPRREIAARALLRPSAIARRAGVLAHQALQPSAAPAHHDRRAGRDRTCRRPPRPTARATAAGRPAGLMRACARLAALAVAASGRGASVRGGGVTPASGAVRSATSSIAMHDFRAAAAAVGRRAAAICPATRSPPRHARRRNAPAGACLRQPGHSSPCCIRSRQFIAQDYARRRAGLRNA